MATESDTVIPIVAERASKNDLVITCQSTNSETQITETKRYGVEIAVLANHSIFFADMFAACDKVNQDREIYFPEKGDIVLAFLKFIFGQDPGVWSFDFCVDVMEMAKKYQAKSVERHAYTQISCAFNHLASPILYDYEKYTRYGRLFILQFILIWQSATNDGLSEASLLEITYRGKEDRVYYLLGEPYGDLDDRRREVECYKCEEEIGTFLSFDLFDTRQFYLKELYKETELSFFTVSQLLELKLFIMLSITSRDGKFELRNFMQDKF